MGDLVAMKIAGARCTLLVTYHLLEEPPQVRARAFQRYQPHVGMDSLSVAELFSALSQQMHESLLAFNILHMQVL